MLKLIFLVDFYYSTLFKVKTSYQFRIPLSKRCNVEMLFNYFWILQLTVKLVLKEWQFSDGSQSFNKFPISSLQSMNGSSVSLPRTGRKINVIVVEGKDLSVKERSGKCNPYVKLQYGKVTFYLYRIDCTKSWFKSRKY